MAVTAAVAGGRVGEGNEAGDVGGLTNAIATDCCCCGC